MLHKGAGDPVSVSHLPTHGHASHSALSAVPPEFTSGMWAQMCWGKKSLRGPGDSVTPMDKGAQALSPFINVLLDMTQALVGLEVVGTCGSPCPPGCHRHPPWSVQKGGLSVPAPQSRWLCSTSRKRHLPARLTGWLRKASRCPFLLHYPQAPCLSPPAACYFSHRQDSTCSCLRSIVALRVECPLLRAELFLVWLLLCPQ